MYVYVAGGYIELKQTHEMRAREGGWESCLHDRAETEFSTESVMLDNIEDLEKATQGRRFKYLMTQS